MLPPYVYQIYSEELQEFRLAAEGFGSTQPPEHLRERVHQSFTPLPEWYAPFEVKWSQRVSFQFMR